MTYTVTIDPKAVDYLKKLDKTTSRRILKTLWKLKEKPEYFGKPLTGIDLWVLRIGDYRVLFELDKNRKKIGVVFIGHRRSIYQEL